MNLRPTAFCATKALIVAGNGVFGDGASGESGPGGEGYFEEVNQSLTRVGVIFRSS